jgi:signal transduction histidine kinase
MIDPAHLEQEEQPFPVQVTGTVLNGQPANLAGLDLSGPFPKNLEIRYTGLLFDSQLLTFRYQLAGYDKTWIDAGTRRSAFYTSLPPGHFQFRVQARNGNGAWVPGSGPLEFTIEPQLTQRPVFWAGLATLLGILILLGYRMRVRHLTGRFDHVLAERERIAQELHDTLLQGLSGITMQLQALSRRLREPERAQLDGVIEDARLCSAEARRSLLGLRASSKPAEDLRSQLDALAQRVFRDSKASLELHLERSPVALPTEFISQLLRICQEALYNAARHAEATHVDVSLHFEAQDLVISVHDDGIGFDPETIKHGHFGLVGMRERAERMGATVEISSTANEGTRVSIRVGYRRRAAVGPLIALRHFVISPARVRAREKQS